MRRSCARAPSPGCPNASRCSKGPWAQALVVNARGTHHIAEQSKFTRSHLWGLKLKESANCREIIKPKGHE